MGGNPWMPVSVSVKHDFETKLSLSYHFLWLL